LTRKNTFYCRYGVFKVRVSSSAHEKNRPPAKSAGARSLKTQQRASRWAAGMARRCDRGMFAEVDVIPGEPEHRTVMRLLAMPTSTATIYESDAYRSKSSGIP